jgi:hypothetical protein
LVVGGSDAADFQLNFGHDVVDCRGENVHGGFAGFRLNFLEGAIKNRLGGSPFAVKHYFVDQTRNQFRTVNWIWQNVAFAHTSFAWHIISPYLNPK